MTIPRKPLLAAVIFTGITFCYYALAIGIYAYILPVTIQKGTFELDASNSSTTIEIEQTSFLEVNLDITLLEGGPVMVTYVKCSDDVSERISSKGNHGLFVRLDQPVTISLDIGTVSARGTYRYYSRISVLVPESAYEPCTAFPPAVYLINISIIYAIIVSIVIAVLLVIIKLKQQRVNENQG